MSDSSLSTASAAAPYEESWEPEIAERIRSLVAAKENEHEEKKSDDDADAATPHNSSYPYCMVALCGVPGSGKTISSMLLASILEEHGYPTMVCPHDGYHYPLDYLKTFPDPEDVIYRRGAPDTFDPQALLRDLKRIRYGDEVESTVAPENNDENEENPEAAAASSSSHLITLPGFDHAKGDPEPEKHTFDRTRHKVVICEGLYLLHDADGWEEVAEMFDLKIFMDTDIDNCIERLKIRNQVIPGYTVEEIHERCEKVDRVNASIVAKSKRHADVVVQTITKPVHKSEQPESPTEQMTTLAMLEQSAAETVEAEAANADWTMDIASSALGASALGTPVFGRSRSNSLVSNKSEPPPPPASQFVGTWEPDQAERISKAVEDILAPNENNSNGNTRKKLPYMVALVGGPGSGKSISSFLLASILDEKGYPTMVCPHDGYHYPLDYLKTFSDAQDFIYRRGAPDTFDPRALLRDLDRIRNGDEEIIKLPAFDHATAEPEPDTHVFDRHQHQVVLCEGLYLLHDDDGWEDVASMFDLTIFMNADLDICIERVKIRNQCIPGYTPEEIEERCEKVDRVNGLTVQRSKVRADVVVDSKAMKRQ